LGRENMKRRRRRGWRFVAGLIAAAVFLAFPAMADPGKVIAFPDGEARQEEAAREDQIKRDRDHYLAQMSLQKGAQYLGEGRYAEAKAEMEWVLTVEPDNKQALKILADAKAQLAEIIADPARGDADDALRQNRLEMECRYYEANSLIAECKYPQAIRKLEMAVGIGKSIDGAAKLLADATALLEKARQHQNAVTSDDAAAARKEAYKLALAYERKQRELEQKRARALMDQAKKYYRLREFELALSRVNAVLEIDDKYAGAKYLKDKIRADGEKAIAAAVAREKKRSHEAEFARITELAIPENQLLRYPDTPRRHDVRTPDAAEPEATGPAVDAIKAGLKKKVSCEFSGTPLSDAIAHLQKTTGCNIALDPRAACKNDTVSGLCVADTEMVHVLNMICRLTSMQWAVKDETILISDRSICEDKEMRCYDVTDLCAEPRSFATTDVSMTAGIDTSASPGDGQRAAADSARLEERDRRGQELADLITGTVARGTWGAEGGGRSANTIQYRSGKLVVSHGAEVHKKIVKLLDSFRRERAIMVSILARYVDINKDYLERAGIDWTGLDNLISRGISPSAQGAMGTPLPAGGSYQGSDRLDEYGIPVEQAWWYTGGAGASPGTFGPTRGTPTEPLQDALLGRRPWPALMDGGERPSGYLDVRGSNVNYNTVRLPGAQEAWNSLGGIFLDIAFLSRYQVHALIEAVEKEKQGTVLTSPRITCFNGQRANIVLARLINYIQTFDDSGAPTINTVTDGVVLEAKPFVSADRRYVTMELLPSITELRGFQTINVYRSQTVGGLIGATVGGIVPIELPEVFIRSVETTVSVPDGGTILIGGLSRATEEEGYASVPLLSKIPLIKYLFMNWGRIDTRTSLVIFVTADILIQSELEPRIAGSD